MRLQVADVLKHFVFVRIAKINKKIFFPNFLNELLALPVKFLVLLMIWSAIFGIMGYTQINGFTLWMMISYYFIYSVIVHISGYYRQLPYTIWNEVIKGEISKFICRPISYIKYQFFYGLGYAYYSSVICLPLVIIISLFFFTGMKHLVATFLFVLSLLLGIGVTFYVYILIGLLSFWTESIFGYRDLILHIGAIFSGSIIPLSFMPRWLQQISCLLPFRYMIYEPVRILIYQYSWSEGIGLIVKQIVCVVLLGIFANIIWKIGIKKYEAQGG